MYLFVYGGTHWTLRCSQGVLHSQGYSAQCLCCFLLLNLPSVFFFICCHEYFYQVLVLSPIPFANALCYPVWISCDSFYIYSNKDAWKKNIITSQTHSKNFSALLLQPWVLNRSWTVINSITLLPSHLQRWIINGLWKPGEKNPTNQTNQTPHNSKTPKQTIITTTIPPPSTTSPNPSSRNHTKYQTVLRISCALMNHHADNSTFL